LSAVALVEFWPAADALRTKTALVESESTSASAVTKAIEMEGFVRFNLFALVFRHFFSHPTEHTAGGKTHFAMTVPARQIH